MANLNCEQWPAIQNTRQIYAELTIRLAFVLMDLDVISFTTWKKLLANLKTNSSSSSQLKIKFKFNNSHPLCQQPRNPLDPDELYQVWTRLNMSINNTSKSNHCPCLKILVIISMVGILWIQTLCLLLNNKKEVRHNPDCQYSAPFPSKILNPWRMIGIKIDPRDSLKFLVMGFF